MGTILADGWPGGEPGAFHRLPRVVTEIHLSAGSARVAIEEEAPVLRNATRGRPLPAEVVGTVVRPGPSSRIGGFVGVDRRPVRSVDGKLPGLFRIGQEGRFFGEGCLSADLSSRKFVRDLPSRVVGFVKPYEDQFQIFAES